MKNRFYCNLNALSTEQQAVHRALTEKLASVRVSADETATGYRFFFPASELKLSELAAWIEAESRCCPFIDFKLEQEGQGSRWGLELTGEEGIKPFLRAEFGLGSPG